MNGILKRVDLGPGAWVLETSDGQRYQLMGDVPAELEGKPVQVEGEVVEAFSFAMAGPTLEVRSIRPVSQST